VTPEQDETTLKAIRVKQEHEDGLLKKANVLGVGVGLRQRRGQPTEEVALVVLVTRKRPAAELAPSDLIPPEIDGVPVDVVAVGDVRATA
jgi:hypothetical protein